MSGYYRTIVVDPPWEYDEGWPSTSTSEKLRPGYKPPADIDHSRRTPLPYASMSVSQITMLPIEEFASSEGCHVYLWTTNRYLFDARRIFESWLVRYSQTLVWCKKPMGIGLGGTFSQNAEFILFGRVGAVRHLRRVDSVWFNWPRMGNSHSRKPEAFYDLVEQVSPGPYLELFARRQRLGWDTHGDEALNHVEMSA